jgi:phosphatidylserine decarboxylase
LIQLLYRLLIELTNRKTTSYLIASFTRSKISRFLIPSFSKVYQIDHTEMEKSIKEYKSLHEFFTRKLKIDARSIISEPLAVASPVDAELQDIGTISANYTFLVKGKNYSLSEMLGGTEIANKYLNGTFLIFYLSPSNYHRIHSPISGKIINRREIGSASYPLNTYGLRYGKKPLSSNYRMITEIDNNGASIAMVKVGAMFINSIELLNTGMEVNKGDEMAYFSFGSTVVLLFEAGTFEPTIANHVITQVRVGECIGYMKASYLQQESNS